MILPFLTTYHKALLYFEGTDTSTTFTDQSGKTWTAAGNAQMDTAQRKFGGASGLFDGTGDVITTPDHADWNFATGDCRISLFARWNALPSSGVTQYLINQYVSGGANRWLLLLANSAGTYSLQFIVTTGGADTITITGTVVISTGVWYRVILSRIGTSFVIYLDAISKGAGTDSDTIADYAAVLAVGARGSDNGQAFNGWLDVLEVMKGFAYTAVQERRMQAWLTGRLM